jgi:hypothetical protein
MIHGPMAEVLTKLASATPEKRKDSPTGLIAVQVITTRFCSLFAENEVKNTPKLLLHCSVVQWAFRLHFMFS